MEGAAAGGLAGHVAGHQGVIGAGVGCIIGHHEASKQAKEKAQRQQQGGEDILDLASAQRIDRLIFGRPRDTAIPRAMIGAAVVVAIVLIVLSIVGDEIVDGEPVMGGDEN